MKFNLFVSLTLVLTLVSCSSKTKKQSAEKTAPISCSSTDVSLRDASSSSIPSLDLSDIPSAQNVDLQDVADVEYVQLETSDAVLLESNLAFTLTKNHILAFNKKEKGIYIFSRKGKLLHRFNRRGGGPEEYVSCRAVTMDETSGEVYVTDDIRRRAIRVYNLEGKFLRSIPVPLIPILYLKNIDKNHLFYCDSSSLLHFEKSIDLGDYCFISKTNGQLSELPIKPLKVVVPSYESKDKDGLAVIRSTLNNTYMKNGDELIIADFGCDTIYSLKNRILKPLLVKSPITVESMNPSILVSPILKTKRYLFFKLQKKMLNDDHDLVPTENIAYDFKLNKNVQIDLFNTDFSPKNIISNPANPYIDNGIKNSCIVVYKAWRLTKAYQGNKLRGKLKKIASKLNKDDNPILMIAQFK